MEFDKIILAVGIVGNIEKLNLEKIAVGGHSYGGATAIHSAKIDKRVKTCFVLDAWINPVPKATIEQGLQKPILSMGRPTWETSDYPDNYNLLKQLFSNSFAPSYNIIIKNTLHLDYTDIPLMSPIVNLFMDVGTLRPKKSLPLINDLVLNFLDENSLGKKNGLSILLQSELISQ